MARRTVFVPLLRGCRCHCSSFQSSPVGVSAVWPRSTHVRASQKSTYAAAPPSLSHQRKSKALLVGHCVAHSWNNHDTACNEDGLCTVAGRAAHGSGSCHFLNLHESKCPCRKPSTHALKLSSVKQLPPRRNSVRRHPRFAPLGKPTPSTRKFSIPSELGSRSTLR